MCFVRHVWHIRCNNIWSTLWEMIDVFCDIIVWKHFPHDWSYVRGIRWWQMNAQHKWLVIRSFDVLFVLGISGCWQTVNCVGIWDAITHMWRHGNGTPRCPKSSPNRTVEWRKYTMSSDFYLRSCQHERFLYGTFPDNKVHGANMGPAWGRQDPGGPHDGPINLAIGIV